jgi:hypothetical protein
MHFKYDQNLEMHNGIHAAIRGKLLEATFAPVWVEPLECSVLGGGYGEPGSTTAQTFAILGISGPKAKRVKLNIGGSPQLSMLLQGYYKLYNDVVAFVKEFSAIRKGFDYYVTTAAVTTYRLDPSFKQALQYMFPKYYKLRMDQCRLDRETLPTNSTGKEADLIASINATKGQLATKLYYNIGGARSEDTLDAFTSYCPYSSDLFPVGEYGTTLKLVCEISRAITEDTSVMADNPPRQGHLADTVLSKKVFDMQIFRGYASIPHLMWSTAKLALQSDGTDALDELPTQLETTGGVRVAPVSESEIEFGFYVQFGNSMAEVHATRPQDPRFYDEVGVVATCLLCLNRTLMNLAFANRPGTANPYNSSELVVQFMGEICKIYLEGTVDYTKITAITQNPQPNIEALKSFMQSVLETKQVVQRQVSLDVRHMMGTYIGSMFSQSILQAALRDRANGQNLGFLYVSNTAYGEMRASRMCMMASAHNIVKCGIITCSKMPMDQLTVATQVSRSVLSLYLTHLKIMDSLQVEYTRNGQEPNTRDGTNERLQLLKNFPMDLEAMCTDALRVARLFQAGRGTAANAAARQAILQGQLAGAYLGRKLQAVVINTGGGNNTITGMANASDIPNEMCNSVENAATKDRLFSIIRKAILDLDRQTTNTLGTHTFSAFDDGGGSDVMHISSDVGLLPSGTGNIAVPSDSSNPVLGSILLESSEQQLASSGRTVVPSADEGEDSDLVSEAASSTSPTGKAGKSAGGKSGASSGKGQFKKVQAKLL